MSPDEELQALRQEKAIWQAEKAELQEKLAEVTKALHEMSERVKTLEEHQSKDSHNSHLPPSSDRFGRQKKTRSLRKRSGKKPGGQAGHQGYALELSESPDEIVRHPLAFCQHCTHDLQQVNTLSVERRQVLELPPPRVQVTEHQAERKQCPGCGQISVAPFPKAVSARVQYGTHISAVAVYLVQQHLLPYKRASEILSDLLGADLCPATIQTAVERCAVQLLPVEKQIKVALRQAAVIHQDETGLYVANKRNWMHVTSNKRLTHYQVHAKRGTAALDANGILPGYQGTSVHDGWAAYEGYGCQHALCNVHLLRDLLFVEETTHQPWARQMQTVLLDLKILTDEARASGHVCLPTAVIEQGRARYREVLQCGERANPPPDADTDRPKRGRRKQSAARNLLDRLTKHEDAVLAYLSDLAVPFDNSQAERDIRMVKVQQKVSGCFRSWNGAVAFCRIRGYLSTLRKQGLPLLSALQQTLAGHPLLPAF
jgi:transposase